MTSRFLNGYEQTLTFLQESGVTATVLTLPANAAMTAETCQVRVTGQQP